MPNRDERLAAKRRTLLEAAADLIIERGYDGASLDAMVERAQCSKTAVYELFGNKEGLLAALTEDLAEDLTRALTDFDVAPRDARSTIEHFGRRALELIMSDRYIAIVRATIGAAWRHPAIGERYFEVGPMRARRALTRFLAERAASGELRIDDAERAARELHALLVFERLLARVCGAAAAPSPIEIEAQVRHDVDSFMRLYGHGDR